MSLLVRVLLSFAVLCLPVAIAQEAPPEPAPQLQKFEPLLGNWAGKGTANLGAPTPWTARGSYRWALDGHFLQEDFEITFEGLAAPMVFRAYYGWDRENQRYVSAIVNNAGEANLHELYWLEDGTMLQVMQQHQNGMPYAERTRSRVNGESMSLTIDMMMSEGPMMQVVEGTLTRSGDAYDVDWQCKGFEGAIPATDLQLLQRSAGEYEVAGTVVVPGQASMKIGGTDSFRRVLGDTIFHGVTKGTAEGAPGEYRGEVFWGFDQVRKCLRAVYVSNMGEVMAMDAWWVGDNQLVATSSGTMGGQPMVQRMRMSFDGEGRATEAVSHTMLGASDPLETFRVTYKAR